MCFCVKGIPNMAGIGGQYTGINNKNQKNKTTMKKLSIKEIHKFISEVLPCEIFDLYHNYKILSEADLQYHVARILNTYFSEKAEKGLYEIKLNHSLPGIKMHPDLSIWEDEKPLIVIELKEWKRPNQISANREFDRLIKAKEYFKSERYKVKRGYLIYTSWFKTGKTFIDKRRGVKYFFEIPILLNDRLIDWFIKEEIPRWKKGFNDRAKHAQKT